MTGVRVFLHEAPTTRRYPSAAGFYTEEGTLFVVRHEEQRIVVVAIFSAGAWVFVERETEQ